MAVYLPKYVPGQAITLIAAAKITGGTLVEVSAAGSVAPAGADSAKVVGVAGFDAEVGDAVTVYRGGVQRLTAAGAIPAGAQVAAAAGGKAIATGTNKIGVALTGTANTNDVVDVAL